MGIGLKLEGRLSEQVEEAVRELIAAGILAPGELVGSVSDLAKRLRVNPQAVAAAYRKLQEEGLLIDRNWQGLYVAEEFAEPSVKFLLKKAAKELAQAVMNTGLEFRQVAEIFGSMFAKQLIKQGTIRYEVSLSHFAQKPSIDH